MKEKNAVVRSRGSAMLLPRFPTPRHCIQWSDVDQDGLDRCLPWGVQEDSGSGNQHLSKCGGSNGVSWKL